METALLLKQIAAGDVVAKEELFRSCYDELRTRAHRMMRHGAPHTLEPTVLVHEAWMKLELPQTDWESRGHFMNVATRAMRCVLVDYARARLTEKRGSGERPQPLLEGDAAQGEPSWRILALDEALTQLAAKNASAGRVAQLRLFGGLCHADIAAVMGVTTRTIERHWKEAREAISEFV